MGTVTTEQCETRREKCGLRRMGWLKWALGILGGLCLVAIGWGVTNQVTQAVQGHEVDANSARIQEHKIEIRELRSAMSELPEQVRGVFREEIKELKKERDGS